MSLSNEPNGSRPYLLLSDLSIALMPIICRTSTGRGLTNVRFSVTVEPAGSRSSGLVSELLMPNIHSVVFESRSPSNSNAGSVEMPSS